MPGEADRQILVAADVPYTRSILRQTLSNMGYQVAVVDNLDDGLNAAGQSEIHLVIADLARVAGGSEQLLLRLRVSGSKVPALIMVARVEVDVLRRLSNLRPVGVLAKPLRIEQLQHLLPLAIEGDAGLLKASAELMLGVRRSDAEAEQNVLADLESDKPMIDELRLQAMFRQLPMLPHVVAQIVQISGQADSSANDLARVIASDPRLAGLMLRVVNSAYFGFSRRISTIPEATVILGLQAVKNLALGAAVCNLFGGPSQLIDRARLWRHALATAAGARALAKRQGYRDIEEAFAAGLLHDLGRLVLERYLSDAYGKVLAKSRGTDVPLIVAERETLGVTHAWVSGWLAKQWNLPPVLRESMEHHHEPELADGEVRAATALVHMADLLVHRAELGGVDGVVATTEPSTYAVETIGILDDLSDMVPEIIEETGRLEAQLAPS